MRAIEGGGSILLFEHTSQCCRYNRTNVGGGCAHEGRKKIREIEIAPKYTLAQTWVLSALDCHIKI